MCRKKFLASALALWFSSGLQAASLFQVYEDALQQDAELAVERAQLSQARAQLSQANSNLLPQVNLTGTYSQTDQDNLNDKINNLNINLSASQPLFHAGAWYGKKAANAQFDAAEQRYRDSEQGLLLRVAEAYFSVLSAEDSLRSSLAEEEAIKRQLDQAQEQYDVGLISVTGVLEARAAYDSARAARIGAEGAMMISYENLEQITGQRYETLNLLNPQLPVTAPEPNDRQAWVDQALQASLALQQARAGVVASEEVMRAQRAGHFPVLSLFGEHSRNSNDDLAYETQTVIGLRGTLEIYGGGRTSAQVRESSAAMEAAQSSEELARRQVLQQTRSLFTQVNTDVLTVQAHSLAIQSAESALQATRTGYEVGTRNIVDVLNAERTLWAARRDYDASRYNYVVNQLRLKRAAGVLTEDDLRELSRWLVAASR